MLLACVCYLMKLPLSHVSSQEGLNGDGGGALLLVAPPGRPHTHLLLDDHSRSGSLQKCNVADDEKKKKKEHSKPAIKEEVLAHRRLFEASAHRRAR